jgi:hypothetical protein
MKERIGQRNRREFLRDVALGGIGATLYGLNRSALALPLDSSPITTTSSLVDSPRRAHLFQTEWRFQKEGEARIEPAIPITSWRWKIVEPESSVPTLSDVQDWLQAKPAEDVFQARPGTAWFVTELPAMAGPIRVASFQIEHGKARVFLNGKLLASPIPSKYTFEVNLDSAWHAHGSNVLAVLLENQATAGGINAAFLINRLHPLANLPQALPAFDDGTWESVGVPHCYNDLDSFENTPESHTFQGTAWYRKRFRLDADARGRKIFLEFQGVNIGAAVYINGKFKPGNTVVPQPGQVTHIGDFIPFVLDITDDVRHGEENVLAVRVCNISSDIQYGGNPPSAGYIYGASFFTDPGFGNYLAFGMGFGGIVSPVTLYTTNKVHIPFDAYSPLEKWGTYVATISASPERAEIRVQTNIENEDARTKEVTLITRVFDADNKEVLTLKAPPRSIAPGKISMFDQSATLDHPQLWYPNNSPYGKPYLYRVVNEVSVGDKVVDVVENSLGIRTITWDADYGYVNGYKHLLNGFGQRNIYPALGSAVPAEIQWNDIKLIADCGGNALRVGHAPATLETVKACDAYGVLVIMDSGDNEWAIHGEPADTYKKEYDRDVIIRYRSHPSIAVWESNNGMALEPGFPHYSPKSTYDLVQKWDYLQPRIVESRGDTDFYPKNGRLMIGFTNSYHKVEGSPSINMEVYGASWGKRSAAMARFDYDDEKDYADFYVTNYLENIRDKACGWIAWMLAETQGEAYMTYLNGMRKQKSLGSCAMDGNRFPKITYEIYKNALWIPFSIRPGVALQSNWNLSGLQNVDAWSNCPSVELFLNGASKGIRKPDEKKRCTWENIPWESGTLEARGLDSTGKVICSDIRKSAGPAHHIALTVEPQLVKPNGEAFQLMANGSDAALVTARIVDADGNWCPMADNMLRFSVDGPGNYRGSYNFYVTPDKPLEYHGPGDPELQAEGGLMRVAVRSTFVPGTVQMTATADGLISGTTSFQTLPVVDKI